MIVVLNVGNTNINLGVIRDGDVASTQFAATGSVATPADLNTMLEELLEKDGASLSGVERLIASSVVPAVTDALVEMAAQHGIPLLLADPTTIPIEVLVDYPDGVGNDRLVNAFAALRLHGPPAIVIDMGTATTFDVVNAEGAFIGGAIAAGPGLSVDALARGTAQLPRVPIVMPEQAIGTDTVAAMQSGAVIGHTGLVLVLLRAITDQLTVDGGPSPKVILTGGYSSADWAQAIPGIDIIDPFLTLEGLVLLDKEVPATAGVGGT